MIVNIEIRKLQREDLRKGFLETLSYLFKVELTPEEAERIYDQVHNNQAYRFFVAELRGEIVGVATLLIEQKFLLGGSRFGYLEDMAVRKDSEGMGIGTLLITAAINEARREGCRVIRLDCSSQTKSFYIKNGFRKKNAHRMQLDLLPYI